LSSHPTSMRSPRERPRSPKTRLSALLGLVMFAVAVVAVAVAITSGKGTAFNLASGGPVAGVSMSEDLLGGIPQRGITLGNPRAPVRLVEFADLQCPYCDEYMVQALPTLIKDYLRTGKLQMQFENLTFIGPDSVAAGRVAAAAGKQGKLWNFVDLLYLNQGQENTGYVTPSYVRALLEAVPGLDVEQALAASNEQAANKSLTDASQAAAQYGITATPSFLIGRAGGPLHQFQPSSLSPAPFVAEINGVLDGAR
jgi:protein-disulfide isomerase